MKIPLINTVVQILGKILMLLISLVTTGMLTRGLGVAIYGDFILITSILILFDGLADMGTRIIGVREASGQETLDGKKKIWINMAILRIILAIISWVLALILACLWANLRQIREAAIFGFSMIVFTSIAGSLEIVWQTEQKMYKKVMVEVLFPVLFLIVFYQAGTKIGLSGVMGLYLIARIVTLVLGWQQAGIKVERKMVDSKLIKKLLISSLPMGLYLLIFSAYDRAIDSMMISKFLGQAEVAWYGLAYKIYGALLLPAYFLVSSIFPIISSKESGKRRVFWISALFLMLGATGVILMVELGAPLVVGLLGGDQFLPTVKVLRWLIAAVIFSYFGHLIGFSLISRNGQKEMLRLGIVVLIFNFCSNLWAIPRFGMMGAAGVTIATEALGMGMMGLALRKKL
jgi:PST family polysaccharide transporter